MTDYRRVYFIQSHQNHGYLKRIIRLCYSEQCLFVILIDSKAPAALHETAQALSDAFGNVILAPSEHVGWGGFSQVQALLNGIELALSASQNWSHFVLLGEQHLPLRRESENGNLLEPGVSYVSSIKYTDMNEGGKKDVEHRYSAICRELPGWGMFPTEGTDSRTWVTGNAQHGSNWVILSREHCSDLVAFSARLSESNFRLRTSIQSDEMYVQTFVATDKIANVRNKETTFVALPHLSGTDDLTFTEKNYFDAVAADFLFIRKAPAELTEKVVEHLEAIAVFSEEELDGKLLASKRTTFPVRTTATEVEEFTNQLVDLLAANAIDVDNFARLNAVFSPRLYLEFKKTGLPEKVHVVLLSEDLEHFKILICWHDDSGDWLQPATFGEFTTHVLKARVYNLMYKREVVVKADPARGFFKVSELAGGVPALASYIERYVEWAFDFSSAVRKTQPSPDITIVAIAKNEGKYLPEWIAYHLAIGVSRIVVYSNETADNQESILAAISASDSRVSWRQWPSVSGASPQETAYNHELQHVTTAWVCFIDIDEFIVPLRNENVIEWLATIPDDVSSVHINWRGFGSSGIQEANYGDVIKSFCMASGRHWGNNHHFKSVARTREAVRATVHNIITERGRRTLSDFQEFNTINNGLSDRIAHETIQINHYQCKTFAEFEARMHRGDANVPNDHPQKKRDASLERFKQLDLNEEKDEAISPFFDRFDVEMERIRDILGDVT